MTCQAILEIDVKDGRYEDLKKWLVKILPDTRGFEGNVSTDFFRNQDNPNEVAILEKWDSRQHYERYLAWRTETGILEELGDMINGELRVRYYDCMGV